MRRLVGIAGLGLAVLTACPAIAQEADDAANANGFVAMAPREPLPGERVAMDAAERERLMTLASECTQRPTRGSRFGSYLGGIAGAAGGAYLGRNAERDLDRLAAAVAGLAIGSTAGYLTGRAYDDDHAGDNPCRRVPPEFPNSSRLLDADTAFRWEQRRRELAGGP